MPNYKQNGWFDRVGKKMQAGVDFTMEADKSEKQTEYSVFFQVFEKGNTKGIEIWVGKKTKRDKNR